VLRTVLADAPNGQPCALGDLAQSLAGVAGCRDHPITLGNSRREGGFEVADAGCRGRELVGRRVVFVGEERDQLVRCLCGQLDPETVLFSTRALGFVIDHRRLPYGLDAGAVLRPLHQSGPGPGRVELGL
jgi:hypothetical protein